MVTIWVPRASFFLQKSFFTSYTLVIKLVSLNMGRDFFYIEETLINVLRIPDRIQQKNCEFKRVAQCCLKLTYLFKKSRPDDESCTNERLDDATGKNMQEELGEQKWNYVFLIFTSFLALLSFSFMKYMDHFLLHLITKKNKVGGVVILYYYV